MSIPTFESFAAEHRAAGADEVLERRWQPNALIDRFELATDVAHAERYGAEGATYWVARRNRARS